METTTNFQVRLWSEQLSKKLPEGNKVYLNVTMTEDSDFFAHEFGLEPCVCADFDIDFKNLNITMDDAANIYVAFQKMYNQALFMNVDEDDLICLL